MPYRSKAVKGANMEGWIARWYARNTAANMDGFRSEAADLAARLQDGAAVLEIAPGPGYLAIALAQLGSFRVTGLDISKTFVEIAGANAKNAGADVEFRQGDAAHLPFAADRFDCIVCRAAFKNFAEPVGALREMHRALRPGGEALIVDMRKDATDAEIAREVLGMNMGWLNALITRATLRGLRGRAYTREAFERMIAQTPFGRGNIVANGIGFAITLSKWERGEVLGSAFNG
jgi:ubiquinone/menaquinone biosynthesis C-methylase UbiE